MLKSWVERKLSLSNSDSHETPQEPAISNWSGSKVLAAIIVSLMLGAGAGVVGTISVLGTHSMEEFARLRLDPPLKRFLGPTVQVSQMVRGLDDSHFDFQIE